MPVETDEERAAFLHPDEFGIEVTIAPPEGEAFTCNVVFDEEHLVPSLDGETEISATGPAIWGRSSELEAAVQFSRVQVGTRVFEVWDQQPDGTGITVLPLREA